MLLKKAFCCNKPPCSSVKLGHPSAGPIATTQGLRSVGPVGRLQQLRLIHTSAASRDPEPVEPIDVQVTPVTAGISNVSSSSSGTAPIRDATYAAVDAVEDAGYSAATAVDETAETAIDAISDAADAAQAAVLDTQQAATDVVSDASDVVSAAADDAAAVVSDVTDAAAAAANDASRTASDAWNTAAAAASDAVETAMGGGSSPAVDWSSASQLLDQRFEGMKVLVTGATGGVGRRVVQALRAKGVACRAMVRDTARAANLLPAPSSLTYSSTAAEPEFDIVKGDVYQYSTLPAAMEGCNAVIVCTAANDKSDPFGPFNIDYQGTLNLVAAAKRHGVKRFVFVTSIGADDPFNPLNLFWGILFWKKRAEEELQRSGLSYTIVRPGGLKNKLSAGESAGNVVMEGPDSFGFPPFKKSGAILRSQVADVCVEALVCPAAADKVVEIVADQLAPAYSLQQLFERV